MNNGETPWRSGAKTAVAHTQDGWVPGQSKMPRIIDDDVRDNGISAY